MCVYIGIGRTYTQVLVLYIIYYYTDTDIFIAGTTRVKYGHILLPSSLGKSRYIIIIVIIVYNDDSGGGGGGVERVVFVFSSRR